MTIDARADTLRSGLPFLRILLGPLWVRRRDVEHVRNVAYGDAGRRQRLDIYRHRSHPVGSPILVLLYRLASQGTHSVE